MRKTLTVLVTVGLGLTATAGIAGAQDTITSDGGYVTANDDQGDTSVEGGGTDIVYGDVSTGNTGGGVLGDPGAIYYPDLSSVPSPSGEPWSPTIVGIPVGNPNSGDMIAGIDVSFDVSMSQAPAGETIAVEQTSDSGASEGATTIVGDTTSGDAAATDSYAGDSYSSGDSYSDAAQTVVVDDAGMTVE